MVHCRSCGSDRVWKDGLRGNVQRYLCRDCGYRFSELNVKVHIIRQVLETPKPGKQDLNSVISSRNIAFEETLDDDSFSISENVASHSRASVPTVEKRLNNLPFYNRNRQVCDCEAEASKNLEENATRLNQAAGATRKPTPDSATVKGKLVEFSIWLSKQGYDEANVKNRTRTMKRLVDLGSNLWDSETVKEILAKQKWTNGYKMLVSYAYENFLSMEGLSWQRPHYTQDEALPFTPTEAELDQLIAHAGRKLGTFLQGLKDTGADPGELAALQWIDVNTESRTVQIRPVKGHNARVLRVSQQFVDRLQRLPKTDRIFSIQSLSSLYLKMRKRAAEKFANPRLKNIAFRSFRHWKGTVEYHRTKDILYVKKILGHKQIRSTLKYIDLESNIFQSIDDQFFVKVANNVQEACALIEWALNT